MNDPYYNNRFKKSRTETKRRARVRTLSQEIETASRMLITTITGIFMVTAISFLYISSLQSAKGYHLEQLRVENEQLTIDSREMQNQLNDIQALNNLDESEMISTMIDTENSELQYVGDVSSLASR
jgi:hypothetical protein